MNKSLETFLPQPLHDKAKLATVVMKFLDLSMKMKAANSKDCQRLLLCQLNGQVSGQSLNNWHLGQVCSLGLAKMASGSHTASMQNMVIRVIKFSTEGYKIRYIFGQKSSYFKANYCILYIGIAPSCQKLGIILENKRQKCQYLTKNVLLKYGSCKIRK